MRLIAVLPLVALLSACGGGDDAPKEGKSAAPETKRSVSSELPKGVKPSNEVLETRKIAGVWRSAPGVLQDAPKQALQLEIAFDKSFTMTLWGKDPKGTGEAVFARQAGKIGRTKDGIAGSAVDARASTISRFASWSAVQDKNGEMVLTPAGGSPVTLRRVGN